MAIDTITDQSQIDDALASADTFWIFKHSNACGTSYAAHEQIDTYLAEHPSDRILKVVIQEHRPISNHIASVLGQVHKSPQLFLISAGAVRWAASHYSITADAMAKARGHVEAS